MFAIFNNMEEFNIWHTFIKTKLNYPLIGTNIATGEKDLENLTTDYTTAKINKSDDRVIAWVGNEIDNLTIIDEKDSQYADWFKMPLFYNDASNE